MMDSMRTQTGKVFVLLFTFFILLNSCNSGSKGNKGSVVTVFAANYPLAYFAEQIGGEHVRIQDIIPKNTDPAKWNPDEAALEKIRDADLILLNGAGYSPWAEQARLPVSKTVNTTISLEAHYLPEPENGKLIPDTWLDFDMAKFQAQTIEEALKKRLPRFKDEIENNFLSLYAELNKLNKRMVFISDKLGCDILYLYAASPVYDYMAAAYQIRLVNLNWEENEPTAEQWKYLEKSLESKPGNAILWESPPPEKVRLKLQKDFDLQSIVFNSCAQKPGSGDFLSVMRKNLDDLYAYSKY